MDDTTQPIGPPRTLPPSAPVPRDAGVSGRPACAWSWSGPGPGPAGRRAGLGRRAARPRPGAGRQRGRVRPVQPGHLLAGVGIALVAVGLAGALATLALDARGIGPAPPELGSASPPLPPWPWSPAAPGSGRPPAVTPPPLTSTTAPRRRPRERAAARTAPAWRSPPRPEPPRRGRGRRRRAGPGRGTLGRPRRPAPNASATRQAAEAAGFRFRDDQAGPERRVRFLHVPNPAWRADGRCSTGTSRDARLLDRARRPPDAGRRHVHRGRGSPRPRRRRPDHPLATTSPAVTPPPGKLGRPADGACPDGQVFRRSGEMMHVWFTDGLATAFARRAPLAGLRAPLTADRQRRGVGRRPTINRLRQPHGPVVRASPDRDRPVRPSSSRRSAGRRRPRRPGERGAGRRRRDGRHPVLGGVDPDQAQRGRVAHRVGQGQAGDGPGQDAGHHPVWSWGRCGRSARRTGRPARPAGPDGDRLAEAERATGFDDGRDRLRFSLTTRT